ncbi:MAG: two-component system, NtrC family, sensor kinase, partial [Micromonosporaceae bacterium]|nr:two-component system, NtrC family, sensor kinase [Micromonosporaceae bacterium]
MTVSTDMDPSARIAELVRTVQEQRRTIEALIIAADRRTADEPDSAAIATWQRNLTLQRRVAERTHRVREAEQLLRNVIDSLDAGLCILADDGRIIDTNRVWNEMLSAVAGGGTAGGNSGVRSDDGSCFFDLDQRRPTELGELLRGAAVAVGHVLADRKIEPGPGHRVMVRASPDRWDERWWRVDVVRVRGHDAAQAVVTLTDVTRETQTRDELRQATRDASRLALVARHMDDAVVIADADGVVEWVNDAFVQMTGFTAREAIGRTRVSMFGLEGAAPALSEHTMPDGQIVLPEFLTRTKDGRPFWLKIELYRVVDDDGVVRLLGVEHDVTARRAGDETLMTAIERSEALAGELSTEKSLLTGVISSIPHLTYWKDSAGRYHGHNAAFLAMRGLPAGTELLGRSDSELGAADEFVRILTEIETQVLRTGQAVVDQQVTVSRASGSTRSLLMSVLPQPDASGQIGGLIGVGADVTRVSELERQLNQTNRLEAIGQLAAGIAHEINTPIQFVSDNTRFVADSFTQMLSLIRLASDLCRDATVDDPVRAVRLLHDRLETLDVAFLVDEIPAALTESLEGLERVAQIVRAMKDFSHPGQGRRDTDVNRAVESTAQVARNEWKYHAELTLRLGVDVGLVPCYEGELKQVVLNLIVNAAHAIEAAGPRPNGGLGHIDIRTSRTDTHVEIAVADDGTGMDDATRQRIFDPFFTTKEVGKGTGQGLSMAYTSIVQKHGGAIRVESAA